MKVKSKKNIYTGPLRSLCVSKLEINDGTIELLEYNTPVVKEILFYRGHMNSFISFDFETIMPDKLEAMDFVKRMALENNMTEGPYPGCAFVNPNEITYSHEVDRKEFKQLKKQYKLKRKASK